MKDIKIEEESKEPKKPAQIPDDPAILVCTLVTIAKPLHMMKYSGC